jgi:hypothetical protein
LELATLLALGEADSVSQRLKALHEFVTARSPDIAGDWTFTGTRHFIAHQEGLSSHTWLQDVLATIEAQDWTRLQAILQTAQSSFTQKNTTNPY